MNRDTIKSFIGYLELASEEEIERAKAKALGALNKVSSKEGKADVQLCLRLIDEEILARLELGHNGEA